MNLYIESIKLWFKGFSENSQRTITYPFIPNKINVITGDSSTGKSSILGIIDYLFLSDNPVIVENIVNENVEFYGMHLYLNGTSYILIRKAPHFGKGSQDVYWEKQQEYPTPYTPTHTVGNMRALLTCMFKVPKHEEKVGHKTYPMTFRHFLPFNYLTEDIISSANTYFDTAFFMNRSFDAHLDYALEYVNGIRCHNGKEVESAIQKAEKDLNNYQLKHQKAQADEIKYRDCLVSIYQIGKEFDLLRFGDNYIINIEIKTESSIDKIFKQQQKNKYYLEFLNKEIYIYTYILNENKLYKLIRKDSNNEIKEATFNELCNKLLLQEVVTFNNIDDLFNPSDYLVSPFNSPEKFMAEGYFLTVQQEQIYNEIRTKLSDATTKFIALTGSAGTGKTLLTYHIAKESIRKGEKVLILHCAPLNSGHKILMEEYGWSIHMPKYAPNTTDFDLIIIDEAQRMYPYQFDKYIEEVRTFNKKCIFSYDENQYLRDNEKNYHTKERIEKELSCTPYKLTDKIRTNKEIAYFIRQLFNLKKNISNIDYPNIELTYCKNYFSAKSLLQELSKKNWKVPNYTPGTRSTFHYEAYLSGDTECAHSVVGQEFDNVVIVIDDSFKYNSQGDLIADNTYYSQRQMLYQIITRTRKKLHIVIIDNEVMLDRCIDILNK